MALRRRGLAAEVSGLVRREQAVTEVLAAGAVDVAGTALAEAVKDADLVVLCTPLGQMKDLASRLRGLLSPGVLVTDVGSAKAAVVQDVEEPLMRAGAHFVGSHPMAGSERTGVTAAREDLFQGAVAVITPTATSDPWAVERLQGLWSSVGARVLQMSAQRHDELVSRSSHLPHLVAAALAHWILAPEHAAELGLLCAAGFRDTTRVASGSPEMWRDIALANRDAILEALRGLTGTLHGLEQALGARDAEALDAFLRLAKQRRDGWRESGGKAAGE
jgi:prephenate dehydrogenase